MRIAAYSGPTQRPSPWRRTAAGFVVPMTIGERADWFQNVSAAAGCTVGWRGRDWELIAPEVIGWADARPAFNVVQRALVPLFGLSLFLRPRDAA